MAFKHELGDKARDLVTGFEGMIVGRAEHITGCNSYGLAPPVDKDGKRQDQQWFDEQRLEIIEPNPVLRSKLAGSMAKKENGAGDDPSETRESPR